ncbi:NADH-dependent [FeFe] hydrogenase, group A6 [Caloranaerobacter ferrireducens]|uniref:Periplasmic [Fe] hydrogenase large subunit n=1 Tax=Caloranaerobacter ferrireducens TaxID=1323370 RepID=A0A0A7NWW4_9FIRM|nr:NADH-dependent [FeFe] hydrogenase, group A6 [Caloranaerobacter ferrireducens]AIZ97533.1 periplasmic [Fe] hydrogenase large subunit [Caloranaerobacter ferrireducens]
MTKVKVFIDDKEVIVDEGTTILEAAKKANINIPTLCYHPDQKIKGICRICIVEIEGQKNFSASCCTPVRDGMRVRTNTRRVREARKSIMEFILARHDGDCLTCIRNGNCELQKLSEELNIKEIKYDRIAENLPLDESNPSIVRNPNKCIKCGRCIEVCHDVQGVGAIDAINRSSDLKILPGLYEKLSDVACVYCGQCINVCPVGAIYEKEDIERVWDVLEDKSKHVVVQMAPAVRVSLGEIFGFKPGSIVTGKIVAFLKAIGFDRVFDTNFTADLTIVEEGNELLYRIKNGGKLPMITSCSPGWIRYIEFFYPELLEHVSTCKSPQQMFGALAKTYYAQKFGIDPKDIVVVSIMPCTAKKAEVVREGMDSSGYQDVDIVLTTRELGKMIKESRIQLEDLEEVEFDKPFGIATGAGAIFGATGGVMEAALRTVYEKVTGKELKKVEFTALRGIDEYKEAKVEMDNVKVKVAVVNGLKNAKMILDMIKEGKADYHFIEVMCCPGGCIGGGGQPIPNTNEIKKKRIEAIYNVDISYAIRKSHLNPVVNVLYEEFLQEPLGHKSHQLLHTHYINRKN